MAKTSSTGGVTTSSTLTICDSIRNRIEKKKMQLDTWQTELDVLLNDSSSDRSEIGILLNAIDSINREITKLKAEQRENNCIPELPGPSQETQNVIGGMSVRRKGQEALTRSKP